MRPIITERDSIEDDLATLSAARHENDAGDHVFSVSWTSVLNNRTTNEFKVGHVRESLLQGPSNLFDADWKFIGFAGVDPVRRRLAEHPSGLHRGPRNTYAQDLIRDVTIDDSLTWIKSGLGRRTLFKIGAAYSRNGALPQGTAANFIGLFTFPTDAPFQRRRSDDVSLSLRDQHGTVRLHGNRPSCQRLHPDKWQMNRRLTLNLGVRYDWQKRRRRPRTPSVRVSASPTTCSVTARR